MAILYMEGFDKYRTYTELTEYSGMWSSQSVNLGFAAAGGVNGGGALDGTVDGERFAMVPPEMLGGATVFIMSYWFKWTYDNTSFPQILFMPTLFDDSQSEKIENGGRLTLTDLSGNIAHQSATGSTTGTTTSDCLPPGVWNRIEIKYTVGTATNNGAMIVNINEVEEVNVSAVNNMGVADDTNVLYFNFGGPDDPTWYIDDVVLQDTTGSAPYNDFLGTIRIDALVPEADGATVDWTRNTGSNDFEMVDDPLSGAPDEDTTYVDASSAGTETRFDFEDVVTAFNSTEVFAVQVSALAKKDAPGTATVRAVANKSASEDLGSEVGMAHAEYSYVGDIFIDDPSTATQWANGAAVDAAEFGLEIVTAGA